MAMSGLPKSVKRLIKLIDKEDHETVGSLSEHP